MNNCYLCSKNSFINTKLTCNHILCIECLLLLEETKCPYCKKNITNEIPQTLVYIIKNNLRKKFNI